MIKNMAFSAIISTALLFPAIANAENYTLVIKDHKFSPQELTIPAGEKVKITVKNEDSTPAEFESKSLNREKVIGANSQATIVVGPLEAGRYEFVEEFHEATTKGTLIVK